MTTTTRDRGDRYGPMEWAQSNGATATSVYQPSIESVTADTIKSIPTKFSSRLKTSKWIVQWGQILVHTIAKLLRLAYSVRL